MPEQKCKCCDGCMSAIGIYNDYTLYKCSSCGYEYFATEKTTVDSAAYEEDSDYDADLSVADDHRDLIQWAHIKSISYIKQHISKDDATILDVGCFNGFYVKELLTHGYDAYGIDFNTKALEFGRGRYGLNHRISNSTVQQLVAQGKKFDVITMFEVIEHLVEFELLMNDVVHLLNPGGMLIISAPNSKMIWRPALDYPPHHLSRFTPNALRHCVLRLGLQPLKQYEQTSSYDLLRNYTGTFFRHKDRSSMRGGEFKHKETANALRRFANKSKWLAYYLLRPIDFVLHALGIRYISQVIIAVK